MRWRGHRESDHVEDRRDQPTVGGGRMRIPRGKGGLIILVIVIIASYYGYDLTPLLTGNTNTLSAPSQQSANSARDDEAAKFTSVIFALTDDTWKMLFNHMGKTWQPPTLVMYRNVTPTACGQGQAAMGPFYCPADDKVYIDLSFYDEMKTTLGADGEFAQGYVIAHEVGHHVQKLLGIESKVRQMQQGVSQAQANQLSVKLELQADCFAGVWGHYMQQQNILEPGDLQQALNAAEAIGDDRLQQRGQGKVVPDSFTHGTSQQRYSWFKRGFEYGNPANCNTFQ
ncbi:hypothetical protein SAMN05216516_102484 [Izhakiella capsodis]|uniref:Neutral zinc metallopeptidase n=1 Tax=Izhakiella capsodis TaxID=1367852 RepID=A0A1I4WGW8_9GAMM|nr:neutral zinc metallopeptidase [Izhakiella capsodis]SFN12647.1 hypothetical protein SAMN05216516_102484 [Izhakiella capsodis]